LNVKVFQFISGVLLALASGAFLHVSLFEILSATETKNKKLMFVKLVFFFVGFAAMSILAIWA
jgi:hypothetical protein